LVGHSTDPLSKPQGKFMPTYDYRCLDCDHVFDKLVKMSEMNNGQECPECSSTNSQKFIGGAPTFGDAFRMGILQPPDGFKDRLKEIAKTNPKIKDTSNYI
jgi:putative FmdB family regulatory protein